MLTVKLSAVTSPEQESTSGSASPRTRTRLIVAAASGVVVLIVATAVITAAVVGGSDSGEQSAADAATSQPAATAVPASSAPTTPTPVPTASSMPLLGTEVTKDSAKVTAFAYKQPVAQNAPRPQQAGLEWAAADVQVCATIDDVVVTNLPWHLVYADHTTISASSTGYNQFPEPSYPWGEKDLPNGRCVRGWITFPVPADKRPTSIEHSPPGSSLTEWAIP